MLADLEVLGAGDAAVVAVECRGRAAGMAVPGQAPGAPQARAGVRWWARPKRCPAAATGPPYGPSRSMSSFL